jgi:hypothetical protein
MNWNEVPNFQSYFYPKNQQQTSSLIFISEISNVDGTQLFVCREFGTGAAIYPVWQTRTADLQP